jgi:hypothetical protein
MGLVIFILAFMNFNKADMDIEKILGYNPQKIFIVDENSSDYLKIVEKVRSTGEKLPNEMYHSKEDSFYYVLFDREESLNKLFKVTGDLYTVESLEYSDAIERKVMHHCVNYDNKVYKFYTVADRENIEKIFSVFKAKAPIIIFDKQLTNPNKYELYELSNGWYCLRDATFDIDYGNQYIEIYPNKELALEKVFKEYKLVPSYRAPKTVLNYAENFAILKKALGIHLNVDHISKNEWNEFVLTLYNYQKNNDIDVLTDALVSVQTRFLILRNREIEIIEKDGFVEIELVDKKVHWLSLSIIKCVEKAIGHMTFSEYNPLLYFFE